MYSCLCVSPENDSDIGLCSIRITKNYPTIFSRFPWNIVEDFLPKCHHFIKLMTSNNNRPDFHI